MTFVGLLFVAIQMRVATKQRRLDTLYQVYDVNRQLLSLGFAYPELFKILTDAKNADPVWERHYLQLWLNQLSLIHSYLQHGEFDPQFRESLERDIAEFMALKNMQRHWQQWQEFYPASFQKLVNGILSQVGPMLPAQTTS